MQLSRGRVSSHERRRMRALGIFIKCVRVLRKSFAFHGFFSWRVALFAKFPSAIQNDTERSPFSPLSLYLFLSFPLPLSFSFAYHHFCIQTRSPSSQEIVQRAVELVRTFAPSWDSRQDYIYLFILVRGVRVANTLPVNRFRIVPDNAAFFDNLRLSRFAYHTMFYELVFRKLPNDLHRPNLPFARREHFLRLIDSLIRNVWLELIFFSSAFQASSIRNSVDGEQGSNSVNVRSIRNCYLDPLVLSNDYRRTTRSPFNEIESVRFKLVSNKVGLSSRLLWTRTSHRSTIFSIYSRLLRSVRVKFARIYLPYA